MLNQSMPLTEGPARKDITRYSQPCLSGLDKRVRYSRHLSIQHERIYTSGRSQLIIHVTARSPKNKRRSQENKSIDRYRQNEANNSHVNPPAVEETKHNVTRPPNVNKNSRQHRSISKSIDNNRNSNDLTKYFQEQNDYLSKTRNKKKNNIEGTFQSQRFPSGANGDFNNNSRLFSDHHPSTKNLWSNTKDFHQNSKINKKRRKRYPGYCPCLLVCVLTALLLGIAIAIALVATLIKSQTTTPQSTISATTTTAGTTLTTTTTSTTTSTTETTTTSSTTSVSTTLTTTISCSTPTSTALYYANTPTSSYQYETYNFTAIVTGIGILEFGFHIQNGNFLWYLDDVSIIDENASNAEMLINGGFENNTLAGWQILCSQTNCGSAVASTIRNSSCHTGLYCYKGACDSGTYDFLQQTFSMTSGHMYILSFWLYTDSQPNQKAFVAIN